jgi:hypothetical protein
MINKYFSLLVALLLFTFPILSQECSTFYPFSEGTTMQITSYGANQKIAAIVDYTVTNVSTVSGVETATMNSTIKDKKGELIAETNYEMSCTGDRVSIDFKSMMSPQIMQQFKDMKTEITGTNLDLPNSLSVGQTLPDASMEIKISLSGINMDMATQIKNRKVIDKESVTTPAGTFVCFVITYNSDLNMSMGMSQSNSGKQWISEGVGMVKQEDYNEKGKVTSSSLLTSFSN